MPAKRKNSRKTVSKKKTDPALKLILTRLDTFDQRFDALDQRIDAVDRKVDAVDQKVDAVDRKVDAVDQKVDAVDRKVDAVDRKVDAVDREVAALKLELKADLQKEFEKHSAGIYQHFSRIENELKADIAELRDNQRKLLTSFDAAARNYEEYQRDRLLSDRILYKLRDDVEELKKRDMEKAAAIDKIEKEIEKSKAA
jgi:chromosome segregation ATPase